jgi:hypothetical protein
MTSVLERVLASSHLRVVSEFPFLRDALKLLRRHLNRNREEKTNSIIIAHHLGPLVVY